MTRLALLMLMGSSLGLSGCAASIAASAVGAAFKAGSAGRTIKEDLREPAVAACSARAAPLGSVRIIDAERHADGRVTVWGTV